MEEEKREWTFLALNRKMEDNVFSLISGFVNKTQNDLYTNMSTCPAAFRELPVDVNCGLKLFFPYIK